jgi:hypothetical protein
VKLRAIGRVALVLPMLLGCAGDLVVRPPQADGSRAGGALSAVDPLGVAVSPVAEAPPRDAPVGVREAGVFAPEGPIHLTEDVASVLRRVVVQELVAAGHRVVESEADVHVGLRLLEFGVNARRGGPSWEVVAGVRLALRVARHPDTESWDEFVYSAENTGGSLLRPGVGATERVLGRCLKDLGDLISEREALAAALERHAREPREGAEASAGAER